MDFTSFFNTIVNETAHDRIMHISIFVDSDDSVLKNMYLQAAEKHNNKIISDPHFYDAGFDLFLPKDNDSDFIRANLFTGPSNKIDFNVKCCAKMFIGDRFYFSPFYTYIRSSMSKTSMRLANNQGIIDAGYRGSLIGMFDCIYGCQIDDYSRILQICAPGLVPIYVQIVDKLEDLGPNTSRGEGGLGSTGK